MKTTHVRHALAATLVGVLLSLLRQPLGADALHVLSADPLRAAAVRGIGLALACVLVGPRHGPRQRALDLVCALVGYAVHGLWLQAWWWPSTLPGMLAAVLPLAAAAAWLGRADAAHAATGGAEPAAGVQATSVPADGEPAAGEPATGVLALVGSALGAAGAVIALEVLARHVRLLGLATPSDDTVGASMLLATSAFGAFAFGGLVCAPGRARAGLAAALAAAAALALVGYEYLQHFEDPALLQAFLKRYGLTGAAIGTAGANGAIAGTAFIASAFALGSGVCGARERRTWIALAIGALLGSIAVPLLYAGTLQALDPAAARAAPGGARWIALGAGIAALGAACAGGELLARRQRSGWIALAVGALAAVYPWTRPQRAALLLSPWQRFLAQPTLLLDAPEGLLTVEPLADGTLAATQHRLRLTPNAREEAADRNRIVDALRALGEPASAVRLLYIGQLTPARQHEFDALGFADWRWTSPLGQAARELSAGLQGGFESAPERWIDPQDAQLALATGRAGEFAPQLALVLPPQGITLSSLGAGTARTSAAPAPRAIADSNGPVSIACWSDAGGGLCTGALRGPLQLSFGGPEELSIAQWFGARPKDEHSASATAWIPTPSFGRAPSAWQELRTLPSLRASRARAQFCAALLAACAPAQRDFVQALSELYGAQVLSSPWETAEQQLELDAGVLDALTRAAADGLGADERELWSALAEVLAGKRLPDLVLEHLEPLARKHAPWPEVEHAVALAYLEFEMPVEALAYFEALARQAPYDINRLLECAAAASATGDHAREVTWLRAAAALQPERTDISRRLGVALVRLGDPAGRPLVLDALLRDPDDSALEPFLGPGPYPPPERAYGPSNSHATETPAEHAAHAAGAESESH
jgi:hypothetical protein